MNTTPIYIYLIAEIAILLLIVIALFFYSKKKLKIASSLFFFGALGFLVSQIIHIPLLKYLPLESVASSSLLLYAALLGLFAGLCEEIVRYLIIKKKFPNITKKEAISFGIGWEALEILMVVLMVVSTIVAIPQIYSLTAETLQSTGVAEDQIQAILASIEQVKAQLNTLPWTAIMAILERLMTLILQIAFTLLIYLAVARKNLVYVLYAILGHMVLDTAAVYLGINYGIYITEFAIFIFALIGLYFIKKVK